MKVTGQKITIYNPTDSNFQPGTIVTIKGNKGYIANYADTNITKFPVGYVISNINESQYGEVLLEGTIEGINTDKFGNASTILYLGGTGNIITTAPTTPVILGSISNSNEVFGSIYFKVILPAGSGSGPSGPATWGLIIGTLSSQGDLNTALNGKFNNPTGTTSQYLRGDGSLATFPTIPSVTPSALTKTDDTNVTLTLGGSPTNALLQAVSLTLGWTGTLADSRIASATNWNSKEPGITPGTTTQYWRGDKTWQTFPTIPAAQVNSDWNSTSGVSQILNKPTIPNDIVTSIATTAPILGGTITNTGTISIRQATSSTDGYLSSADWITFNGKQNALVSGTTIKTVNSETLLGSGNVAIPAGMNWMGAFPG